MPEPGPLKLESEQATISAGRDLARIFQDSDLDQLTVFLSGDLGAGKTTFARGFLQDLGHSGRVPSPTYTLIEPYELDPYRVYHIDLYRLADPREVEDLGIADLPEPGTVLLIEWPERAGRRLKVPDLEVVLAVVSGGRDLAISPRTGAGKCLLDHKNA